MTKKMYRIVDAGDLARRISVLQGKDDELSFAATYETDEDGEVLEQSVNDWYGVKFAGAFDGTFLLFGEYGGGKWYAYDASHDLDVSDIEAILFHVFKDIRADNVCMLCMNTFYCVTSMVYSDGRVSATVTGSKEADTKPESKHTEKRDRDIYTDWFGSMAKAKAFAREATTA